MEKKLDKVGIICDVCGGEGYISKCCGGYVDTYNRCSECNKFCKKECCYDCGGEGETIYKIGDDVDIFICIYSNVYLKALLSYQPLKRGESKTFHGTIKEFVDRYKAVVEIDGTNYNINIEDISLR